jgi:HD-like signal output (HDOD) protein/prolyl-tRNA editing enzyme YbaK/EbsC (Cys-tRNA(Pro) deacylase)
MIMSYADLILSLLDKQRIDFQTMRAPDTVSLKEDWLQNTVPLNSVGRISMMEDDHGLVMAIFPADHMLNIEDLQAILHRQLRYTENNASVNKLIARLKNPKMAVSVQYGLQIIIDATLTDQDYIHFQAPTECTVLRVKAMDMGQLSTDALLGGHFSNTSNLKSSDRISQPKVDIKKRIEKLDRLPAMPDMPSRILAIRNNPNSTVDDLVAIIENDLSLSAQIIRYSNSAMFSQAEPVTSLRDAVFRVLGYETVLHLSLGYALGRVFKLPATGPLGHDSFWKHSTYSAALVQQLATAMPRAYRPQPGLAYLCGLLHDIGFLVLNLFFKNEHAWLNKLIAANPDKSVLEIENRLMGATHAEIGQWLMKAWNMPQEICVTVSQHHNLSYAGPFAEYALLVNLSERLLKTHGMSDSDTDEIPQELLDKLGLEEEEVFVITDEVLQGGETLKEMAIAVSG